MAFKVDRFGQRRAGQAHGFAIRMCCLLAASVLALGCSRSQKTKPNIVLVVVDDLRADHLRSYGYARDTAPFLDTLVSRGVLFQNVISHSSWTKTSMASMMSSLNPDAHGVRTPTDVLADSVRLLPEILRDAGYRALGVTGNPWLEPKFGFNQGYEYYVFSHWHNEDMSGQRVVREAIKWLRTEPRAPFFIYLHFMDVHSPFEAPEGFDLFGATNEDHYDGSIRYIDAQLAWLYERLGALELLEDTWFVFTSDHGEEFWDHGDQGHGKTLYDEVLKVPLVFYHPDIESAGTRVSTPVRIIDVAPTVLELVHLEPPPDMHGVSLKGSFVTGEATGRLHAFSRVQTSDEPGIDLLSMSSGGFKYIVNLANGNEELYDLSGDPGERRNLVSERPELTASFREEVSRYREGMEAIRPDSETLPKLEEDLKERLRALGYLK